MMLRFLLQAAMHTPAACDLFSSVYDATKRCQMSDDFMGLITVVHTHEIISVRGHVSGATLVTLI